VVGFAHGTSKVRSGYVCLVLVLCFGVLILVGIAVVQRADNVTSESKESGCWCGGGFALILWTFGRRQAVLK
jgi:hypothetical protein